MFDTHCHLNFKIFDKTINHIIQNAKKAGIDQILIPGTDVKSSQKAVEIAGKYERVYAAVGIHPHNIYQDQKSKIKDQNYSAKIKNIDDIEQLLKHPKVVAIGEVGLDYHMYQKTKYQNYSVDRVFVERQKQLFIAQIKLAAQHHKSLIIHNREARADTLKILAGNWSKHLEGRSVFHCCEPDDELLDFAIKHRIFIGVDGDVTYNQDKQEFVKKAPLDLLVLETDSPYLLPRPPCKSASWRCGQAEPLKSKKQYPNTPENIRLICDFIALLFKKSRQDIGKITTCNAMRLFGLP